MSRRARALAVTALVAAMAHRRGRQSVCAADRSARQWDARVDLRALVRDGGAVPLEGLMAHRRGGFGEVCERMSTAATSWTGSTSALISAVSIIVIWLISGPLFHYSDTWQLVINTGTTIITFLMVFLIQRSQNKESLAVQLKLNELVAAVQGASNRLIDVEDLTEDELKVLHKFYQRLSAMAKHDDDLGRSHSVDEAQNRHNVKHSARQQSRPNASQ
jgi:low affinity Fe/Cu permease